MFQRVPTFLSVQMHVLSLKVAVKWCTFDPISHITASFDELGRVTLSPKGCFPVDVSCEQGGRVGREMKWLSSIPPPLRSQQGTTTLPVLIFAQQTLSFSYTDYNHFLILFSKCFVFLSFHSTIDFMGFLLPSTNTILNA